MKIHTGFVLFFMVVMIGVGCAKQEPAIKERTFPTPAQTEMNTQRDIKQLAADVAPQIEAAIVGKEELEMVPLFITATDDAEFTMDYADFLTAELVRRGVRVSSDQEDMLVLEVGIASSTLVNTTLLFHYRYLLQVSSNFYTGPYKMSRAKADAQWRKHAIRRPANVR